MIENSLRLVFLFPCKDDTATQSVAWRIFFFFYELMRHRTKYTSKYEDFCHKRLPVVPAPVYAIKHLLVDNSHNFTKESFPEDSKYCNSKSHHYSSPFSQTIVEYRLLNIDINLQSSPSLIACANHT